MRKLCFVLAAILCASAIKADLCEDFNSLTSGSWTTETAVELPSGTWMFGGGLQYNKSNNVVSLKFSQTGAYLITPMLDSVTSVEFKHRSGGSKKQIDVAYRIGLGEWVEVNSVSSPSSSMFSSFSCKLGTDSAQSVQVRFSGTNNTYIDDVVLKQYVAGSGDQGTVVPAEPDPEFTRPTYTATHATYYLSPAGNDETGDGSFDKPWLNLGKAISVAQAGDVIYCRGGVYKMSWRGTDGKLTVRLKQSGTAEEPIVISAYENEKPVFDFEQQLLDCNRKTGNRKTIKNLIL